MTETDAIRRFAGDTPLTSHPSTKADSGFGTRLSRALMAVGVGVLLAASPGVARADMMDFTSPSGMMNPLNPLSPLNPINQDDETKAERDARHAAQEAKALKRDQDECKRLIGADAGDAAIATCVTENRKKFQETELKVGLAVAGGSMLLFGGMIASDALRDRRRRNNNRPGL